MQPMPSRRRVLRVLTLNVVGIASCACAAAARGNDALAMAAATDRCTVSVLTRDGATIEGELAVPSLTFAVDGLPRQIALPSILSCHAGAPASADEARKIAADLAILGGADFRATEVAAAELSDIGLPVL